MVQPLRSKQTNGSGGESLVDELQNEALRFLNVAVLDADKVLKKEMRHCNAGPVD